MCSCALHKLTVCVRAPRIISPSPSPPSPNSPKPTRPRRRWPWQHEGGSTGRRSENGTQKENCSIQTHDERRQTPWCSYLSALRKEPRARHTHTHRGTPHTGPVRARKEGLLRWSSNLKARGSSDERRKKSVRRDSSRRSARQRPPHVAGRQWQQDTLQVDAPRTADRPTPSTRLSLRRGRRGQSVALLCCPGDASGGATTKPPCPTLLPLPPCAGFCVCVCLCVSARRGIQGSKQAPVAPFRPLF